MERWQLIDFENPDNKVRVVRYLYIVVSRDQNAGRSHSMKIDNSSIERVEEFKYLGATLTS